MDTVTVMGNNFGTAGVLRLNGTEPAGITYMIRNGTTIQARFVAASATTYPVTVVANGQPSNTVNLTAAIVLVLYFGVSVFGYAVHGALRDTDNQLARPQPLRAITQSTE